LKTLRVFKVALLDQTKKAGVNPAFFVEGQRCTLFRAVRCHCVEK
jgi:hypothetical protein